MTPATTIRIYDPALCCDSGVCGVDVDPARVAIAADIAWARANGAHVERFNLARDPQAFVDEPAVRRLLERTGREALPVTLVDGEVTLTTRYPDRAQLGRWCGLDAAAAVVLLIEIPVVAAASSCCSGGACCGGAGAST
jgi:hypothetical protein